MASTPLQQLNEHGQSVWVDYLSRSFIQDGDLAGLVARGRPRRHLEPDDLPGARSPRATPTTSSSARCSRRRATRRRSSSRSPSATSRPPATCCARPSTAAPGRLGLARGRPEPRPRHRGHDRPRPSASTSCVDRPEPVREDPRHARGPAGDRGVDRRRHPDQRDADLLARAPPRGRRGLRPRPPAAGRERRRPDARSPRSPRSSSRASTPRPTSASTRSAATTSSRASSRSPTPSSPTRPTRRSSPATAWEALAAKGATAQRCLWASTSTKNPDYRDVLYVEELIGPDTVNTMPRETIEAFQRPRRDPRRHARARTSTGARAAARGPRGRRDRLRRRRRDARARGRGEVREVVRGALRRRREPSATSWWPHDGDADFRRELGQQLRVDSVRSSAAAGSGHPTSSMSAADLMAVLIDEPPALDCANPHDPATTT